MAITRNITIDGAEVPFRASAALPRFYRFKFRRDLFADLQRLADAMSESTEEASRLDLFSLETFENIAYVMARSADPTIPDSPEEWLDRFNAFSIYEIMPQLFELWGMNVETRAESKKKLDQLTAR